MFFESLLIILASAGAGKIISRLIGQPDILGEILMGMLVGNLGIVPISDSLTAFADMGVLLLLFEAGMSMGISKFKQAGENSMIIATMGIIVPFGLGFIASYLFGFSLLPSLFVGGTLVATSVGIGTSILEDRKMLRTEVGSLIVGSAVVDDVLGIITLAILSGLVAATTAIIVKISWIILAIVALFGATLFLGPKLVKRIPSYLLPRNHEDLMLLVLLVVIGYGLLAQELGLEAIVGSFLAGLLLSEARVGKKTLDNIISFGQSFFVPLFFVVMGLRFDVTRLTQVGPFAALIVIIAIASKILGCGAGAKVAQLNWGASLAIGTAMVPRAEVSLIIAQVGYEKGIIGAVLFSVVLMVVAVTTLITPSSLKKALGLLSTDSR